MADSYKILYRKGEGEVVEKKSRFIAEARPVKTEEEALAFIEEIRKKYWDARHHCFAYVIGERGGAKRCSDDGEPSQTAGRPILDVLEGQEITDACVVVTRYFGGTLLGTGGLVRAYSSAAQESLKNGIVLEKRQGARMVIRTDYNDIGKIQYTAGQMGVSVLDTEYTDRVTVTLLVPVEQIGSFTAQVAERTNAKAVIEETKPLHYGILDKELVLFD